MRVMVYAAVAVLAAAAGFGIYRYAIEPHVMPPAPASDQPESVTREEAPPPVPTVLPEFSLEDRDGAKRSIRSWPQKSMVVNFWATWCAPCRREIPFLKQLQKEHAAEEVQVVGVAVDFRDDVLKYADEIGIDYPLLIGEQDGLDAVISFGMGSIGFPFTVFTDKQQRIVTTHLGELKPPQAEVILGAVRRINSGELTVEAARTEVAKQLAALEPDTEESEPGA